MRVAGSSGYSLRTMQRARRGRMRGALAWLVASALLAACPNPSVSPERVEALLAQGDEALREGRAAEANQVYQEAASLAPKDARPLRRQAIVFVLQGRDLRALEHFERADPLDPGATAEELVFWATALQRQGRFRQAVRRYEEALEANPRHVPAMNNLAALLRQADPERALRLLEEAVRLEPGDGQLVYNLARLYGEANRIDEAYNLMQRALAAMSPDDPAYARRREQLQALRERLPRAPAPPGAPNVLLILVDTLRADHMGLYGYGRDTTPHIDAFAREAVVFENAVVQAPWTAPSVASLFTGLYPSVHGLDAGIDLDRSFDPAREDRPMALQKALAPSVPTLAEELRRHGYTTAGFVSQVYLNSVFGFGQGFERYRDAEFTTEKIRGERTNELVLQWLEEEPGEPFFLFVHYNDPHFPYDAPEPFGRKFVGDYDGPLTPADTKQVHKLPEREDLTPEDIDYVRALYDGEIAYLDSVVGGLLERVRSRSWERPLLVVLTADHGEEFFEHGGTSHGFTLYDEQLRVPLVVLDPRARGGRRVDAQVRVVDLKPTLLELAGIGEPPAPVQGTSFAELVRGEADGEARAAFSEATWDGDAWAIRAPDGLKLILHPEDGRVQLFDLTQDPKEQHDLAAERPEVARRLEQALRSWVERNRELRAELGSEEGGLGEVALDEELQTQLRALGYLE